MSDEDSSQQKSEVAKKEEEILKFWQDNKIFEKSLEKPAPNGEFVFYDGPPFATGVPHYGHILASAIKDAIPRYKTMRGYYVRRRWGWDCHGLPIENIAEKDLKISGKKQIEEIGIKKFNEHARSKVLEYIGEWKKTVDRIGRWVDFDGSYKTMDNTYMESVWWAIKQFQEKGLLYEGTRVLPYCPRCETPIANSEIAMDNSYKDIKDISVTVKFELIDETPSASSGQARTFVLAWTTTPWTLPGNVALAVNPDITYVEVEGEVPGNKYIVAKPRVEAVLKNNFKILKEFQGKDLIGRKYKPLFDYYVNDSKLENRDKGWKIYGADFVTTEDGTGIVHEAPAFGEVDMNLAKAENLPIIWHVDGTGRFTKEVKDFARLLIKPKDDTVDSPAGHMVTDIEIIKYLEEHKLLFSKEKITHSYPHCFRCETPLYYYAIPAWFIDIQKVKADLLNLNERRINWVPDHLKNGRFKNSVEAAPDWNISRNRYWATPLPIWKCQTCKEVKIIGSVDELTSLSASSGNKYFFMRHGEAEANAKDLISTDPLAPNNLTDKGRKEVEETIEKIKKDKIDLIFSSDFIRTKETVELAADGLGVSIKNIIFDQRLREIDPGQFKGKTWREYNAAFGERINRLNHHLPTGGENYNDIRRRIMEFLFELDQKYQNKRILIVSHGLPLFMMQATVNRLSDEEIATVPKRGNDFSTGELREIKFVKYPHNDNYELDLHRPYIDEVIVPCACGGEMKRITEVVDCWLESGSMPFAANHYPFTNEEVFNPANHRGFPAQFIAEYIAQTRTWFYYMLVMAAVLLDDTPFENVVTTGTILAEDGQKMSKSKGNFPDPWIIFNQYGVDALRLYLLASPVMRAEDLNFSEKSVAEVGRKIVMRLLNVLSFYQMYVGVDNDNKKPLLEKVNNVLDKWILLRLRETVLLAQEALDHYEIDRAIRPIDEFIDDLSTWYLRRSRERFKSGNEADKDDAATVIKFVLREIAKTLAPIAPFVAEEIYRALPEQGDELSVHLASWPELDEKLSFSGEPIGDRMKEVRRIVSLGLELRAAAAVKVRQPLASLRVKSGFLAGESDYQKIIIEELNVKKISFDSEQADEVWLDTEISSELKKEGIAREFIRQIQEKRKQLQLKPQDNINLTIEAGEEEREILRQFEKEISLATTTKKIDYDATPDEETIEVNGLAFKVKIVKL